VVQGGVGQHRAEHGVVRGDVRRDIRLRSRVEQDDRRADGGQQRGFVGVNHAAAAHRLQRFQHHGEGLVRAGFARAQAAHSLRAGGVAGQVVAAQPLDRHDVPGPQQRRRAGDVVLAAREPIGGRVCRGDQAQARPADRAGVRLGVKAAVQRVVVFRLAGRAHGEGAHGGHRPVVGHGFDDGVARPAVGAVGEGVAVAAVGRVQDFRQAVGAGGHVRRDQGCPGVGGAVADGEGRERLAVKGQRCDRHPVDAGQGRRFRPDRPLEGLQGGGRTLHGDVHAGRGIEHPAGQAVAHGQTVDEGPESHALHHTVDMDVSPLLRVGRHDCPSCCASCRAIG